MAEFDLASARPVFDLKGELSKTDKALGLPDGFSAAQIKVESGFNPSAVSPKGAMGLAQVMPATLKVVSQRLGRDLDPMNPADAVLIHREVMRENLGKFGSPDKALMAYNGGWDPAKWGNPETRGYVAKVSAALKGENPVMAAVGRAVNAAVPSAQAAPAPEFDLSTAKPVPFDLSSAKPALPAATPVTRAERFTKGLVDPIEGGAQLLTNMLPQGVVQAGNSLNNWLADKTGLVARLPEGGVDQQVREGEAEYQRRRAAAGDTGADWMRVGGNVLNPANLALATRLPAAATLAGRVALSAAGGGAAAALNPVASGDFWTEKGKQVAAGAAGGAAVPAVTGAVARVVSPQASINPAVQALRAEGVRPTVGQTLGGMANRVEEKLTSVPLVGDMIANARRGAAEDLNRAAFNRALAPIGQRLPAGAAGREAVEFTEQALSNGYNRLLPQLTARADPQFTGAIGQLRQAVNTGAIDPNAARAFNRILDNDVLVKFGGQGAMTGETLKRVESDLGQQIARLGQSTDADQRLVRDALQQVQAELRDMLVRNNPGQARELGALNTAWANFKRVQRAAAGVGAEDGVFSAAQLQSAVKAMDRSKDKAAFARGNALMQDLSDPAKAVLGSKVPDSGTAGRMLTGGVGQFFDPTGVAPFLVTGGAAAYLRPAQNALTYMLAERPQLAQPVANSLRQAAPMFVPLGAQVGLNALMR